MPSLTFQCFAIFSRLFFFFAASFPAGRARYPAGFSVAAPHQPLKFLPLKREVDPSGGAAKRGVTRRENPSKNVFIGGKYTFLRKALSRKWKKSAKPDFGEIFLLCRFSLKNVHKWARILSAMKKGIFLAVVAALGFGIYVYAQDKTKSVMPVAKEVPKAMAREDAMKLTDEEWKKRLTPEQYRILRQAGTERSNGQIYKEFKAQGGGTYHCAGCGTKLFSSDMKYESGSGWPSFFKSLPGVFEEKTDMHIGYPRTEYHCKKCKGHHGHIFEDGPKPTGKRYCNNGVCLIFYLKYHRK